MFCFALLTCCALCAASQCKQKKQHIEVLQTLVYFDPPLNDVIQETDHRLLTGYNKPIIGCEKNQVSHPYLKCDAKCLIVSESVKKVKTVKYYLL